MNRTLDAEGLARALAITDLTDSANGIHAVNLVLDRIIAALAATLGYPVAETRRQSPVVPIADNYDRLHFPADNIGRSPVYTRYVSDTHLLRTQTTAIIPDLLLERPVPDDRLIVCPGLCYRRDVVNRTHVGEIHQMDIWRIKKGEPALRRPELIQLIEVIVNCVKPGGKYRGNEMKHPYTINGLEVEILIDNEWLEILECGEAHPQLLADSGLNPDEYSGLAMGVGLDRLVMVLKRLDDIRLLRANDLRIRRQMTDLEPYIPVSKLPPVRHDMSIAADADTQIEDLCEVMKHELGKDENTLEEVTLLSETPYEKLPSQAIDRIGMQPGQKNMLVRIVLRSHERTLTQTEANIIRDRIYLAIHKGTKQMLAARTT